MMATGCFMMTMHFFTVHWKHGYSATPVLSLFSTFVRSDSVTSSLTPRCKLNWRSAILTPQRRDKQCSHRWCFCHFDTTEEKDTVQSQMVLCHFDTTEERDTVQWQMVLYIPRKRDFQGVLHVWQNKHCEWCIYAQGDYFIGDGCKKCIRYRFWFS